jgi:hypothetical protein
MIERMEQALRELRDALARDKQMGVLATAGAEIESGQEVIISVYPQTLTQQTLTNS